MALVKLLNVFALRAPQRVRVNFNAVTADGLVRVRRSRFQEAVQPGSTIIVFEPEDEIEGFARVARIDGETGLVYLDIAWDSLHDLLIARTRESVDIDAGPVTTPSSNMGLRPRLAFR